MNKGAFFCITLILLGLLDLATTLVGTSWLGALEANPLLAEVVASNTVIFCVIKASAVFLTAFMFYKIGNADVITGVSMRLGSGIVQLSFSGLLVFLTSVVTNNLIVLTQMI